MPEHTAAVPLYSILPFVLMLGAIAVLPLISFHFWEDNKNKLMISGIFGIPTAAWLIFMGHHHELEHIILFDYIPFIVLLGGLFVITGGILLGGSILPNPKTNTLILGIGAVLASLFGTTGAAMLLIRPVIRSNEKRKYKVHTILFFIAIVANCGGMLTPLGDPPLFMMYLRGTPFTWFANLAPEWLTVNGMLLALYLIIDSHYWKKERDDVKTVEKEPIKIRGGINFLLLLGVILAVLCINGNTFETIKENHYLGFLREGAILLLAFVSMIITGNQLRRDNKYSWEPIKEVAYLFIGIFVTMVPALMYLKSNASELGLSTPVLFYYVTGGLSGILDNTPTAVTFYSVALGLTQQNPAFFEGMTFVAGIPEPFMSAICLSAVFFGSMTYIGNGPNFMVKAIAESRNIRMPDFFGYMWKFSLIVLLPIFILVQLIFVH